MNNDDRRTICVALTEALQADVTQEQRRKITDMRTAVINGVHIPAADLRDILGDSASDRYAEDALRRWPE